MTTLEQRIFDKIVYNARKAGIGADSYRYAQMVFKPALAKAIEQHLNMSGDFENALSNFDSNDIEEYLDLAE